MSSDVVVSRSISRKTVSRSGGTPPATKAKSRPGGRTGENSARISEAVQQLLMERGFANLTLKDVAAAAGVSRTTLYRRWDTRAALVLDVINERAHEEIVLHDRGSLEDDLLDALRQIASFIRSPFGSAAIASSFELSATKDADELRRSFWYRRLTEFDPMFERGIARGEVPVTIDVEITVAALAGAVYYAHMIIARDADDDWIRRLIRSHLGRPSTG